MKKFTENLVYIPYFILEEIKPEYMHQIYIDVLTEAKRNIKEVRQYWGVDTEKNGRCYFIMETSSVD